MGEGDDPGVIKKPFSSLTAAVLPDRIVDIDSSSQCVQMAVLNKEQHIRLIEKL